MKWIKYYQANRVIVVNNAIAEDIVSQSIYRVTFPKGIRQEFLSIQSAQQILTAAEIETENERLIVFFKDIETLWWTDWAWKNCKKISFSRLPFEKDKRKLCEGFYVSDMERSLLTALKREGVSLEMRAVPTEQSVGLNQYL